MKKQVLLALSLLCPALSFSAETPGRLVSIAQSLQDSRAFKATGNALSSAKLSAKDGLAKGYSLAGNYASAAGDYAKDSWKATTSFVADHCNRALFDDLKEKAVSFPAQSWATIKENPKITTAIIVGAAVVGYFGFKFGKKLTKKQQPKPFNK